MLKKSCLDIFLDRLECSPYPVATWPLGKALASLGRVFSQIPNLQNSFRCLLGGVCVVTFVEKHHQ